MKVEILSGSQAGAIVEMDQPAAESAIASGYAKAVAEKPKGDKKPRGDKKPE